MSLLVTMIGWMTGEQFEDLMRRVRSWPQARREDAARILLAMEAQDVTEYVLSPDERADIEEALGEADRGEIASDAEVAEVFRRFRR
jgi:hypothetical protein